MNMNQPVRWQHFVLIATGLGAVVGAAILALSLSDRDSEGNNVWLAGVAVVLVSVAAGALALLSLRKDLGRAALAEQLAKGLFHLPASAPAALIRFNAALPPHFGLTPTYLKRPMPATFGEIVAVTSELAQAGASVTPSQHDAARAALAAISDRPIESLPWDTKLADVIPGGRQRFRQWERLRQASPPLPAVTLNPWVENIAIYTFLAALIAIAVPIAQRLDRDPATRVDPTPVNRLVGKALGIVLFATAIAVLMVPVYVVGRRYAARLPDGLETVGSLAPFFPSPGVADAWRPDVVATHLRELIAHDLGLPPAQLTYDTVICSAGQAEGAATRV